MSKEKHTQMLSAIEDCQVIIAGGMGRGALVSMQDSGKKVFVVNIEEIDTALKAYIDSTLDNRSGIVH